MSLWYESLGFCLNHCGENPEDRAKCILAYLSMPVPRFWWESALRTGTVDDTYASVLRELRIELSKVDSLRGKLSSGLLVALAFIDSDMPGDVADRFSDVNGRHTFDDYLTRAKEILAERPDLAELGKLIDEEGRRRV